MSAVIRINHEHGGVVDYQPQKLGTPVSEEAKGFVNMQSSDAASDFRMEQPVRLQSGVAELEALALEKVLETQALEKLKEVKEKAYREAFELGKEEGKKAAFEEYSSLFQGKLQTVEGLLSSIGQIKEELVSSNEKHIMSLLCQIASKIAMEHIEVNEERIKPVLKEVLKLTQEEEDVKVFVSQEDHEFLQIIQESSGKELQFLKNVSLKVDEELTSGGCFLSSNYGQIDATLESRIERVWKPLLDSSPLVKERIESE